MYIIYKHVKNQSPGPSELSANLNPKIFERSTRDK